MSRLRGRNGAPLTMTERRLVVLIKLYQKEHRQGPTWRWVQKRSGLTWREFKWTMRVLRNRKAVSYKDSVYRSTYATEQGVEAALHPEESAA